MSNKGTVSILCVGAATLVVILGLTAAADADEQQLPIRCAAAEVQSVSVSTNDDGDLYNLVYLNRRSQHADHILAELDDIDKLYYSLPTTLIEAAIPMEFKPERGEKFPVRMVALGPVADVDYSRSVQTDVSCTARGFLVTATLTFGIMPFVLRHWRWRPQITIVAVPLRSGVTADVKWQVRLGKELEFLP